MTTVETGFFPCVTTSAELQKFCFPMKHFTPVRRASRAQIEYDRGEKISMKDLQHAQEPVDGADPTPAPLARADAPSTNEDPAARSRSGITRRSFLTSIGVGATLAGVGTGLVSFETPAEASTATAVARKRRNTARKVRTNAAKLAYSRGLVDHPSNNEEVDYPYVGNFSKGLPHNNLGEVETAAYGALLTALSTGSAADFEAIPLGGTAKLRNPQSGLAFDLEGPDSHATFMRPAPRIDGPENSGEMVELYWMSEARDVPFTDYGGNPIIGAAATDLNSMSDFRGPKIGGSVTARSIFRGPTMGEQYGPYVSQFLLRDVPYGSLSISHRQRTLAPSIDYMTEYDVWLHVKTGGGPTSQQAYDPTPRYPRNGRDLAAYVQVDALYEAYLNACLILLGMKAPLDAGNPYLASTKTDAFTTFGGPHILSLVTEVATRALKAVWFQKWYVHRRLRPEEFGGRVHNHLVGDATYAIDGDVLNSPVVDQVFSKYGTYLLPQAFADGCPLHPAYGSGHATVAGACITILKAWFDESYVIPNPVVASTDGTVLMPYTDFDAGMMTVGSELNKVASNIASGRNFAGIHWRTDFTEGMTLGEAVAIGILQEQKATYNESSSFTLTKLDGTTITI